MFAEPIIANFLTKLKQTLNEFQYLPKEYWSPGLEFDERLRSHIVKLDVVQGLETKKWIGLVWNLDPSQTPEVMGRPYIAVDRDLLHLTGSKYDVHGKAQSFNVAAFSSDPYYCLWFQEMFGVKYDRSVMLNVLFPPPMKALGVFPLNILDIKVTGFEKIGREEKGSLTKVSFSFNAIVPYVRLREEGKLIGRVTDPFNPELFRADVRINQNIPQEYIDNMSPEWLII